MRNEHGLVYVITAIRNRVWIVLLTTFLTFVMSLLVSQFLLTPIYESKTQLLVNKTTQETFSKNEIDTNKELMETYRIIVKSPKIMKVVNQQVGEKVNLDDVTVISEGQSQIMRISVRHEKPQEAMKIANIIANIFSRDIYEIMKVDNVTVLSPAELPEKPVSPKLFLNAFFSILFGLVIGMGLVIALSYFNQRIETEKDIEQYLNSPLLGTVMDMNQESDNIVWIPRKRKDEFV